jgi:hypothetical protein
MRVKCGTFKAVCWLCVGLTLSTCSYDLCLAQDTHEGAPPDSLNDESAPASDRPASERVEEHIWVNKDAALFAPFSDSLATKSGSSINPLFKKWWFWAFVTTAIALTAVLLGGGEEKKAEEDLPGFPDPPDR